MSDQQIRTSGDMSTKACQGSNVKRLAVQIASSSGGTTPRPPSPINN